MNPIYLVKPVDASGRNFKLSRGPPYCSYGGAADGASDRACYGPEFFAPPKARTGS